MVLMGGIESLIDFFSFTVSFFYAMAMAALLVLRRTRPNLTRPYKVSNYFNILTFASHFDGFNISRNNLHSDTAYNFHYI